MLLGWGSLMQTHDGHTRARCGDTLASTSGNVHHCGSFVIAFYTSFSFGMVFKGIPMQIMLQSIVDVSYAQ